MEEKLNKNEIQTTITQAQNVDIEGLQSVFSVLEYNHNEANPEKGFLVTPPNIELIKENIENPKWVILIQKNEKEIVGYTFGFELSEKVRMQPNYIDNIEFTDENVRNFVKDNLDSIFYWQHIGAVSQKGGDGRRLAEQILGMINKLKKSAVLGEICEGPIPNNRALTFHKNVSKMDRVGEYSDDKYNIKWGVYFRKFKDEK